MATEITTMGGGEGLYYILNGVAAICSSSSFTDLIKITVSLGVFWISFRTAFNFPFGDSLKWFMGFLVLYNALLIPKETVLITDKLDPVFAKTVDNVPYGLVFIGGNSGQIGNSIAELFDQNFALPDDIKYSKNGFLFGTKLIEKAARLKINDSEFSGNMEQFTTQCILFDIALNKYTVDDLKSATNIWNFVFQNASRLGMFTYSTDGNKEYVTCAEGAGRLENQWNNEINSQLTYLYRRQFGNSTTSDIAAANYISASLQSSDNYLMNSSKTSTDIIRQNLMINAINDASYSQGSNSVSEYASLTADISAKNSFIMMAEKAQEWIPLARTLAEAAIYGLFPFVFLLFLLPMGFRIFTSYVAIFIWIQSWPPLYAIFNLLMSLSNQKLLVFAGGSYTLNNFSVINNINDNMSILAGAAMMSIPLITIKLIPFSQNLLSGIGQATGQMLAPVSSATASAAHEATTGNLSLGNTSYDNHSASNISANKFDTSISSQSYGGTIQNSDGSISKFTGDGIEHLDNSQNQSLFTHDMKTMMSMSNALQKRAGESESIGHNLDKEAQQSLSSSFDIAARMAHNFHQGKESGESWTKGVDSNLQQAMENINNITSEYGINGATSLGSGIKIGGNYNLSKSEQDILKNSIEVVNKASKSGHFNITDSEGKSLSQELNSSYNDYKQLSERASTYHNQATSLSEEATKTKSFDATIATNEATGFYNWLRDSGMSRQDIVSLDNNPDRDQSFQALANQYMEMRSMQFYSKDTGQELLDTTRVGLNQYHKEEVQFDNQHKSFVKNKTDEAEKSYNNLNITDVSERGIDNSNLKEGVAKNHRDYANKIEHQKDNHSLMDKGKKELTNLGNFMKNLSKERKDD